MSSITSLTGSTPVTTAGAATIINTNFSNLNTDKIETSVLDTDTSLAANSDTKIATQKAVKAFVEATASPTGKSWNEYAVGTSGTDSYAIAPSGVTAYVTGQTFKFKADVANTGACSLNVNGLGAKTIKKNVTSDLATGDILANQLVVVTYDGTNMQLTSTEAGLKDATQLVGSIPAANLPTPAFYQRVAIEKGGSFTVAGFGSNQDGSNIFIVDNGVTLSLMRLARDSITGTYEQTHSINMTLSNPDCCALIVIGLYLYVFTNNGTNVVATRFLAADLTGETNMTVPTLANTTGITVWTDGTFAYVVSQSSSTTSNKWSVSGTTFSASSTATCSADISSGGSAIMQTSVFDGTNVYVGQNETILAPKIMKLTDIVGTSVTTTTKKISNRGESNDWKGFPIINIDSTRMYMGFLESTYDETNVNASFLTIYPISKP